MIARVTYFVVSAALLLGFLVIVVTGGQLIATGSPAAVGIGICAEVLVALGCWFLWKTFRFGRRSAQLARQLEAEGGLPVDELQRSAAGRIDKTSADQVFARRKAEAEAAPDDWRSWFRLAVAYADASDTPRARKTMQHAIKLHDGRAREAVTTG